MSSAVSGSWKIRWAIGAASSRAKPLASIRGRQLGLLLLGHRLHLGAFELDLAFEQLALALHADVLAGRHAEGAREQPGDPGEEHEPAGWPTPRRPRP